MLLNEFYIFIIYNAPFLVTKNEQYSLYLTNTLSILFTNQKRLIKNEKIRRTNSNCNWGRKRNW